MSKQLDAERTALVVIDVQDGFSSAVIDFQRVVENTATLVAAAKIIGLPIITTEQYPKGLGDTAQPVLEALDGAPRLQKTVFSAAAAEGFDLQGRDQVLVCGIEAHVCVNQTVLELLEQGLTVHVVSDAVSSRTEQNCRVGLERMQQGGAVITSVEMALFELLKCAGTDKFKTVQRLII